SMSSTSGVTPNTNGRSSSPTLMTSSTIAVVADTSWDTPGTRPPTLTTPAEAADTFAGSPKTFAIRPGTGPTSVCPGAELMETFGTSIDTTATSSKNSQGAVNTQTVRLTTRRRSLSHETDSVDTSAPDPRQRGRVLRQSTRLSIQPGSRPIEFRQCSLTAGRRYLRGGRRP